MITYDYTNVLESAVGSHGIPESAFSAATASAHRAVEAVETAHKDGKLGFANLPLAEKPVSDVLRFAREHAFKNIVILGIGGSALGPAALESALARPGESRKLVVLDNIDPDFIAGSLEALNPADTFVNVIAKSGVTAETMATFAIVRKWMVDALGPSGLRERIAVTTDPEKGDLLAIARQERFPVFEIPRNVGGRFSVLTPVGTLPAALLGLDVQAMMRGAAEAATQARKPFAENPALTAAFVQWVLDHQLRKSILVLFPYSQALWKFAFWFKQLWGESLGKKFDRRQREVHCGQTPTAALGVTDQHSQLQLFIEGPNDKSLLLWSVRQFNDAMKIEHPYGTFDSMGYLQGRTLADLFAAERQATEMAITEAGRPNSTVTVDKVDEAAMGSLIMFSQYMTAYAGEFYDIDAFDQPGVEYGKKLTFCLMDRPGFDEYRPRIEAERKKQRKVVR
ncbi:MAG TPA: glucose-6-phosphate isomerase [Terriglobia bacterium]|nr:glucose-6-phosphate isomerase [Terriglobia bacterium]